MIRLLWLKRFFRDSKGISTAIGTVLLVLAMFVISSNVFLFTISQNTAYSQSVRESHQTDADRFNEQVIASDGNYSVWEDKVEVEATLTNTGAVAAQIINLWVFDTTQQKYGFNDTISSLNLNLNPGQILDLTGPEAITVTIPGVSSIDNFNAWFVTARGNTVPVTQAEVNGTIVAQVALGIGSVGMDFGSFVYYHVDYVSGKYRLRQSEWRNGLDGYTVPDGTNIAFRVILTNFDTKKRTIMLNAHSVLWMIFPTIATQVRCAWWYIVNVDGNGIISSTFSQVSLPYGQPTMVYFASSKDLTSNTFSPSSSGYDGPAAVNLMLFGTIGTSSYGQNIPFVSVYVT